MTLEKERCVLEAGVSQGAVEVLGAVANSRGEMPASRSPSQLASRERFMSQTEDVSRG